MPAPLVEALPVTPATPRFVWLDLTRTCQLSCTHCLNGSGPAGTHGTMTRDHWLAVLDQAAVGGTRKVQFFGGEPTLHPNFAELVEHALAHRLEVEVYTNLVHVPDRLWTLFQGTGLSLATSYYSDRADEHNTVTGRRTHGRTRANIGKAVHLGIPLRVAVIDTGDTERASRAARDLVGLGVTRVSTDHVRPFGRGAHAQDVPAVREEGLCGNCGDGKIAVSPTGVVTPCVFTDWLTVGNVQDTSLAAIVSGGAHAQAVGSIRRAARAGGCEPDDECTPGFPGSSCTPRT